MFSWWSKKPDVKSVEDENTELLNAPETPAAVFAARALKSAIFGTPGYPDDTIYDAVDQAKSEGEKESAKSQLRSLSPTKPAGILLTPGTATIRRKTVSFDHKIADEEQERSNRPKPGSKSGIPDDCPGKFPSPWVPKTEGRKLKRSASLTEAFEAVRSEKTSSARSSRGRASFDFKSPSSSFLDSESLPTTTCRSVNSDKLVQEPSREPLEKIVPESDTTVDLNEPHSKSGKFWKSEYEHYHEEALAEMKKLIEYKELAKSFAQTKDHQAMSLVVKLKDEQQKVTDMEDKISRLTSKIARMGRKGHNEDSPTLVRELARQTALTVQYKAQVQEFRSALEANGIDISPRKEIRVVADESFESPRTEQTILDLRHELRKAREQLKEMSVLREEVERLRGAVSNTGKASLKLEAENAKLTTELLHADLRLENHMKRCGTKSQQSDEEKQKTEEAMKKMQKDYDALKEQMRSSRRDADTLLKKRQDQLVDLRKEIASMRGSESAVQELQEALQKKDLEHGRTVEEYKKQIEDLKNGPERESGSVGKSDNRKLKQEDFVLSSREWYPPKASPVRESQIPVATSPNISRPMRAFASKPSLLDDSIPTIRHRASQPALSEIIKNADVDTLPPLRYGPVQHTPIAPSTPTTDRFVLQQIKSPELTLPCSESTQLAEPARNIHARNCQASPRPSMFNIASSPPKAAFIRPRSSNGPSKQKSYNDLGSQRLADANVSRLPNYETTRTRVPLPPERAAAAKARLEAKAAEKRRAQQALEAGKENIKE